jgi:hypothetical protein
VGLQWVAVGCSGVVQGGAGWCRVVHGDARCGQGVNGAGWA